MTPKLILAYQDKALIVEWENFPNSLRSNSQIYKEGDYKIRSSSVPEFSSQTTLYTPGTNIGRDNDKITIPPEHVSKWLPHLRAFCKLNDIKIEGDDVFIVEAETLPTLAY